MCRTNALFHYTKDGLATIETEEINEFYWRVKNDGGLKIWSGVKAFPDSNKPALWFADAPEFTYTPFTFG